MDPSASDRKESSIANVENEILPPNRGGVQGPVNGVPHKPYTVLSERAKIATILIVASVNTSALFASTAYYPALYPISKDLDIAPSKMYLTITSYMLMQGIAPLFTGSISDQKGRRPILLVCMLIFILATIGLALQRSYVALILLRCLQSVGSAGVFIPTFALVVDIVARAERGKYMAYVTVGSTVGTSTGPIIGGILSKTLGWRSVFWFLVIFSVVVFVLLATYLPETCRAVVGDGSISPPSWNRPIIYRRSKSPPDYDSLTVFSKPPKATDCFKVLLSKEVGFLIFFWSLISWGQIVVEISLPLVLGSKYHLNSLHIGLCYIPWATGAIAARWSVGSLADWNFRRLGQKAGMDINPNQQIKEDLERLPLERIRLDIALPVVYLACALTVAYSWAVVSDVHISCPLVLLFFLGNATTGATNVIAALIVDLKSYRPATVRAAMAIFRSLPGAGVAAAINPAIDSVGFGWLGTIISSSWIACSCILWIIYLRGQQWRTSAEV
ncbi:hypothetical protein N7462_000292 [Penicillium macrosclerotiorum]|uniref:uncharacterized protein n=1 Tax=Penicillium macrosclerotiorum TaxID=303699 RepID=UPI00254806B2|nr:uncharacterized protein N7462_000292 [Penicillium macrosclerotiorum]KAJ5698287.1 hypothetical protein N7462_000292 [Penicillium macrosclerotiorum]